MLINGGGSQLWLVFLLIRLDLLFLFTLIAGEALPRLEAEEG